MAFWQAGTGFVRVAVKVQPRSRRPSVGGTIAGATASGRAELRLRIAVAAPAEGGRANAAVCAALAAALDVPRGAVALIAGASSAEKILRVDGDPAALAERLEAL